MAKKNVGDLCRRHLGKFVTYKSGGKTDAGWLTLTTITHDENGDTMLTLGPSREMPGGPPPQRTPLRIPKGAMQVIEVDH